MKKILHPDLTGAIRLSPAEMNKIHFAGNRTPLTPEQLQEMASHAMAESAPKAEKSASNATD